MRLARADLWIILWFFILALTLRLASPLMFTSLSNGLITNCVHSTPIDAAGHLGTLCGLAYPYQKAGSDGKPVHGEVFDEVHFANYAFAYMKGSAFIPDTDLPGFGFYDVEPLLAKLLIGIGEWGDGKWRQLTQGVAGDPVDLGFNTFGWRIMACIFGSLLIPLMYLLAFGLWSNRIFAATAAFLCCFDGLFFVQSRIAMLDIFSIFFIMLSYVLFLFHLRSQRVSSSLLTLGLTGVALGLAASTKWLTLAAWGSIGFFLGIRLLLYLKKGLRLPGGVPVNIYTGGLVLALLVIPAGIYVLTWLPFFFWGQFHSFSDLVVYQFQLYKQLSSFTAPHPYGSKWYTWPFLYRPVGYYSQDLGVNNSGQFLTAHIFDLGNPIIWWASIPAILALPYFIIKERSWPAAVILVGFITQYLPFSLLTRVTFIYYMFGSLIFMILALAFVLNRIHQWEVSRWLKMLLPGYLVLVVFFFAYFYPTWTAVPIDYSEWLNRMWFPNWH